eukprot:TRINITY_DN11264_c0_g1_i4.p1 TRINITY_DN11264_c0_g1~~TRINITY_DN11264_c0_g1_i4.p1  ORF type:complete len:154 (-),score=14.92 TRINITY_DN11264_c0_g1_i4:10-471(-)
MLAVRSKSADDDDPLSAVFRALNCTCSSYNCGYGQATPYLLLTARDGCSGRLSESVCELTGLREIVSQGTELSGTIPGCIHKLTYLTLVRLADNKLHGNIPTGVCQLKRLRLLNLAGNNFTGEIPACIGDALNLEELVLFGNRLDGIWVFMMS